MLHNNQIIAIDFHQYAYPVGEQKDSYYLLTRFTLNVLSGVSIVQCEVVKNFYSASKAEVLYTDSAKNCVSFLDDLLSKLDYKPKI